MMDNTDIIRVTGRCLCSAVAYQAAISPQVHVCHCGMCRRWCGGPAMAVRAEAVTFTAGEDNLTRYASSDWAHRVFCKTCGSNLFYQLRETGNYVPWVGALDDAKSLHVHGEIYVDDKPQFYNFTGGHERLTGAEFIQRLQG